MSRFTSTARINTRWRNNDFVGEPGSTHTFPDAFHEEFLLDWALQIADGTIIITETPTTGVIQMASLTVGDITLTGTATGFPSAPTITGTSPIDVVTASGTSTISLNANYQTAGTYVTSITGTTPITTSGTTAITVGIDQAAITGATAATNAEVVRFLVKNTTGTTIPKGSAVYVSGATGDNALISLASATAEASSSKTLGLTATAIDNDAFGYVIEAGYLTDIDTSATTAGAAVWLGNTPGSLAFVSPPAEPSHAVYLGVVVRVQSNNGSILVKVQNGYEIDELHDVSAGSPSDGDIIQYKTSSALWTQQSISQAGIAASVHTHAYQPAGTYVTAVNGTAPIAASTDTAGIVTVSLTANYQTAGTYITAVNGTAPITASTDTAGVVTVGLSASYASDIHTHNTSSITSGNFVATLAAGTGVTVTGADDNAAAKTVAIGQAVETNSNVTFNNVNINGANSLWVARITANAVQSLTNNTLTKISFNTATSTPSLDSYDPKAWFDDANDRIVIGQDGFYNITANVGFASNSTSRRLVQIFVNGSDRGSMQVTASSAGSTLVSVSTNVYLAATDYVEVHALQQSGGALNTANTTGVYPALSVGRIGA